MTRRPIDPSLKKLLDAMALAQGSVVAMPDLERARVMRSTFEKIPRARGAVPGLPNDVEVTAIDHGRLFKPKGPRAPVLVYLHGGGWVVGSSATHDAFCRLLSAASNVAIASIDYRLAPEHPYPAALDDAAAALAWVRSHADALGVDGDRVGLGGDSAGANLAAVIGNRVEGLRALMLLFPVTDHPSAAHPSYVENATGYGLDAATMRWYWARYAPAASPTDPEVAPLRIAEIPSLPPTLVATAEYDVLRDEGLAYVARLRQAGIDVTHLHAEDMHHNFPVHPATVARFPQSDAALADIAAWLKRSLS